MCGIVGIINRAGSDSVRTIELTKTMLQTISYRGPDSFVVEARDNVYFGHVRFSIVDLVAASNQPFSYANDRYWLTFNGEIYNFIELRQELQAHGYSFRTLSDTEVILAAYDYWGTDCLSHFNGMWAFAIYDKKEQSCFLARDRFGVKPLYYAYQGQNVLFASEMKALLAAGISSEPELETIQWYFHDAGSDRADLSPFKAIRQVPAGHYLLVKPDKVIVERWWETLANRVEVPASFAERVALFRELFEDAVRIRLRNDVNTAITLSGGMDSSAVYGISKVLQGRSEVVSSSAGSIKDIKVFSVSYPGQVVDEAPYVEACLRRYNDQATYVYPTPANFAELINDVIWHQESFVWNASVFAYHLIYKEVAKAGIRVVLEGHGSDEMLGGYPYLVEQALASFRRSHDWGALWQAAKCLSSTSNPAIQEKNNPAWQIFLKYLPGMTRASNLMQRGKAKLAGPEPAMTGMNPLAYLSPELLHGPAHEYRLPVEAGLNPLQAGLYEAFHRRIVPNVLRVFDRATMAAPIESRMPFMDYRLVQYIFSLPITDIIGGGETKHILREAVKDTLPAEVVRRKAKMGFAVSLKQWFDDPAVSNYLKELVHDPAFAEHGLIDGKRFTQDFDRVVKQGFSWQDTARVWEAVNLSLWWQIFVTGKIAVRDFNLRNLAGH